MRHEIVHERSDNQSDNVLLMATFMSGKVAQWGRLTLRRKYPWDKVTSNSNPNPNSNPKTNPYNYSYPNPNRLTRAYFRLTAQGPFIKKFRKIFPIFNSSVRICQTPPPQFRVFFMDDPKPCNRSSPLIMSSHERFLWPLLSSFMCAHKLRALI